MNKPSVFISYSKHDVDLKDRLVAQLGVSQQIDAWDDSRIGVGEDWLKAILDAIDGGCVAVLLVSARKPEGRKSHPPARRGQDSLERDQL